MDVKVASLLIRQHMRLIDEGVGPRDGGPADETILRAAAAVAGHLFTHADLCDVWLGCPRQGRRECQEGSLYPAYPAA